MSSLAYPAGALSDRMSPRNILMAGIAVLIAGNSCSPRAEASPVWSSASTLWGAHMALTQGIFARMIADSAPEQLRATSFGAFWFVSGIALLASLGAGLLWDREGSSRDLPHQRGHRRHCAGDAQPAGGALPALSREELGR